GPRLAGTPGRAAGRPRRAARPGRADLPRHHRGAGRRGAGRRDEHGRRRAVMAVDDAFIERVTAVHTAPAARLLAIPGVRLVALGSKETDGIPTGELAIRVHVRGKRPA